MSKVALITGVTGQDGAYLSECTEVELLIGDPTKAKTKLGWEPEYDLEGLVNDMVDSDIKLMEKDKYLRDGGYKIHSYYE